MRALTLESRPRIGWGLLGAGGISDQLARAFSVYPSLSGSITDAARAMHIVG